MSISNRKLGDRFEQEFAELLGKNGFWAHIMKQSQAGQPSDIIAVKGKFHTLIDAKEISDEKKGFPFTRIEENQRFSMSMFWKRCGEMCYFALKLPSGQIRMISYTRIKMLEGKGYKSITMRMMDEETMSIDKWLECCNAWAEE